MSIKERALQEAEYAAAAAAIEAQARDNRERLDLDHRCRTWFQETLGVTPEEIILRKPLGNLSKAVVVRLEDDIWLLWASEGKYMQTHADGDPACWYIYLDKHVRQAYNTTTTGVGPEGWDKAHIDVSLARRVTSLASLGEAIRAHETWKEKQRG